MTYNKRELITEVAKISGFTKKDTEATLDAFMQAATTILANGDDINMAGFGKFTSKRIPERPAVHPTTGEKMIVAAYNTPKFRASSVLKNAMNQ